MSEGEAVGDRRTSVSIMAADLERLQAHQRRVSAARGVWVTMPDVIRELIDAMEKAGEGA